MSERYPKDVKYEFDRCVKENAKYLRTVLWMKFAVIITKDDAEAACRKHKKRAPIRRLRREEAKTYRPGRILAIIQARLPYPRAERPPEVKAEERFRFSTDDMDVKALKVPEFMIERLHESHVFTMSQLYSAMCWRFGGVRGIKAEYGAVISDAYQAFRAEWLKQNTPRPLQQSGIIAE